MGVGGIRHAPPALPCLMTRYPLYRTGKKISPPLGFDFWTVQPVDSRYTVYVIPAHRCMMWFVLKHKGMLP